MGKDKDTPQYVVIDGHKYIRSQTDTNDILTSVEKSNGRTITLVFTRDKELSERTEKEVAQIIKRTIIENFLKSEMG